MIAPVLCLGAAHWDTVGRAGVPLGRGGDVAGRIARRPGGVALNVALALAGHGRAAKLIAAVGRDAAGDDLIAAATALGVDCAHALRPPGRSDAYLVIEDATGEIVAAVADCAAVERAGTDLLAAFSGGRTGGWTGRIVADGNLPADILAELAHGTAFARADIVFACASPGKAGRMTAVLGAGRGALYLNRREAEALCGAAFADSRAAALALRDRGVARAIVTDGAAAATHASPSGVVSRVPPPVATRSLTGAGDVFLAAHLVALDRGLDPAAALDAGLGASTRHIDREAS